MKNTAKTEPSMTHVDVNGVKAMGKVSMPRSCRSVTWIVLMAMASALVIGPVTSPAADHREPSATDATTPVASHQVSSSQQETGIATAKSRTPEGFPYTIGSSSGNLSNRPSTGDWIFDRSLYTNDRRTGKRVLQYTQQQRAYRDPYSLFDSNHSSFPFTPTPGQPYPFYSSSLYFYPHPSGPNASPYPYSPAPFCGPYPSY